MLIVADENMPLVHESFSALGEVRTVAGRRLMPAEVEGADILLVRSVTRVDAALLKRSRVRFVGTATIGTDHLDLNYLRSRGIQVASAPGSNANAVVDYVLSAICALDDLLEELLAGKRVGIIGLGNVGVRLLARLQNLGIDCNGYDPLLPELSPLPRIDLAAVLDADLICCHAPLTRDGPYPTYHLLNAQSLRNLRARAVLLNAGRGGVVDNLALKQLLGERHDVRGVLDVWEGEPAIDTDLLARAALGTPHIAGYSLDGKVAGTRMMLEACCNFLRIPVPEAGATAMPRLTISAAAELRGAALIRAAVHAVYDCRADDQRLRIAIQASGLPNSLKVGNAFDQLRKQYPERREISACAIENWSALDINQQATLLRIGFVAPSP